MTIKRILDFITSCLTTIIFLFLYRKENSWNISELRKSYRDIKFLFQPKWYSEKYNLNKSWNPFLHYTIIGIKKEYDPSDEFNTDIYRNSVVENSYKIYSELSIFDFISRPNHEPTKVNKYFNGQYYLKIYPDVSLSGINPLLHYIKHGKKENRKPNNAIIDSTLYSKTKSIIVKNTIKQNQNSIIILYVGGNPLELKRVILNNKINICKVIMCSDIEPNFDFNHLNLVYYNSFDFNNKYFREKLIKDINSNNHIYKIGSGFNRSFKLTDLSLIQESVYDLEINFKQNKSLEIIGLLQDFIQIDSLIESDIDFYRNHALQYQEDSKWAYFQSGTYIISSSFMVLFLHSIGNKSIHNSKIDFNNTNINTFDIYLGKFAYDNNVTLGLLSSYKPSSTKVYLELINSKSYKSHCSKFPTKKYQDISYLKKYSLQILNHKYFSSNYYVHCPLKLSPLSKATHYIKYGADIGLNPSEQFNTLSYAISYEDVRSKNPLIHYINNSKTNTYEPIPERLFRQELLEIIKSSNETFDSNYYLNHVELEDITIKDPLWHYHTVGWKMNLEPSQHFSGHLYYSQITNSSYFTISPLLHKAITKPSALIPNREREKTLSPKSRIIIFAGYNEKGVILNSTIYYLQELQKHGDVYYLCDGKISDTEIEKIKDITINAWSISHQEYDFGSYKRLMINLIGWKKIEEYDELLLVNDSCYLLKNIDSVFNKMNNETCDWWCLQTQAGMYHTRNLHRNLFDKIIPLDDFLQNDLPKRKSIPNFDFMAGSYFIAFRKNIISDNQFKNIISSITKQDNKKDIIIKYEIGITRYLLLNNYTLKTFSEFQYPLSPVYSLLHFKLIRDGFPLLKKGLLSSNHYKVEPLKNWKNKISPYSEEHTINQIEQDVLNSVNFEAYISNLNLEYQIISDLKFEQKDLKTKKDPALWVFPVCGFDHTISGNLRAMYEEVKDKPEIKKIILLRSKAIKLKGINTESVALFSQKGQDYLLKAKVVFIKHTIKRNVHWPLNKSNRIVVNLWHGIPFKKIGIASLDQKTNLDKLIAQNKQYTSIISSSIQDRENMKLAFDPIDISNVWLTGMPRIDMLLCEENKLPDEFAVELDKIRKLKGKKKLIAFLPTFRNNGKFYEFTIEDKLTLLELLHSNGYIIGVREHMAISGEGTLKQLEVIGACDIGQNVIKNVESIYREADILITDYSSAFIDFMLLRKPILSFAYDYEEYSLKERGVFYSLTNVFPGEICVTFKALILALSKEIENSSIDRTEKYDKCISLFFKYRDVKNANRVYQNIMKKLKEK